MKTSGWYWLVQGSAAGDIIAGGDILHTGFCRMKPAMKLPLGGDSPVSVASKTLVGVSSLSQPGDVHGLGMHIYNGSHENKPARHSLLGTLLINLDNLQFTMTWYTIPLRHQKNAELRSCSE